MESDFDLGPEVSIYPYADRGWPFFVEAQSDRLREDFDYALAWFRERKPQLDGALADVGALVFRGLPLTGGPSFSRFIQHYPPMPQGYAGGAAKRVKLADRVYDTTTTRAPNFKTRLHQEMAYLPIYPKKVAFFCHVPPATGGETPIADIRALQKKIPGDLFRGVEEKGILYTRCFRAPGQLIDAPEENQLQLNAFYRTWTDAFATEDRAEAEKVLKSMDLEWAWLPDGGLSTSYRSSGFINHPRTGEQVWFNSLTMQHANYVAAGMSRELYARAFPPDSPKSYNVVLGDGSPIDEDIILQMYDIQDEVSVALTWRPGDLMLLDNIYVAHGGNPYTGPRDIQVSMFY